MNTPLSAVKNALLEKWLQGEKSTKADTVISPRPQNSPIKISFPQQSCLFPELLDRGTAVNNLSVLLKIKGMLDFEALNKSANQILDRHEIVRTRFSMGMGMPVPEILDNLTITIPIVDLTEVDKKDLETEVRRLAEKEVLHPFDLSQAPLFHLKLYRIEEHKYFLLLIAHHTIADGWSLGVFLNELMKCYAANTTGISTEEGRLPIQYFDYAYWQTSDKHQDSLQSSKEYWKKQLGGELPGLELPTDFARGAKRTFAGGTHRFTIPEDLTKKLEELSRQEDATLFMTLLAAFYLLLHRYTGEDDILVGVPIANRNLPELENLIGVFINTLVIRVKLSADASFRELLRQVRTTSLDAYANQDFPYEKLVEELKPKRDLNRPPLFQVVFNLQNSPMPRLNIAGLETEFLEIDRGVSQFDITLMITKNGGQCHALVEYNADLFKASTIERMFRVFQKFLEHALTAPDTPISKLQIITSEELHHMVFKINKTTLDFPREKCIHQLVEDQVEKTPDEIGIIHDQTQITYREMNQRANMLANYIRELGVGPEIRVGILMKKSIKTVEVLLGVLKAGGAYVPIHISSPPERIQFILEDADVEVLITNLDPGPLNEFKGIVVNIEDENILSKNVSSNPNNSVSSNNLAYIIYTSGSTGEPKGVMVNHSSLVNFLWSMQKYPGMNAEAVIVALAAVSFDPSTLELFLPLIVGGKIVIASEEMTTNPLILAETIQRHDVNILQATPATWQLLLDTGWAGKPGMKALCGGDVMTRKMADQLLALVGSLWNVYGPTETTVWSSVSQIEKDDRPITIGQPIGNMQFYILDQYLQTPPVGVIGELHITGEGVSRGYLNNPQLTGEKFIANPFSSKSGVRLYKTGDLARYLPNYEIELLGRNDDQVKVQGHRIELGEVTAVLLKHPSVNDGIVVTRIEKSGDKKLVAYFVPKSGQQTNNAVLREYFIKKLPEYMIPSFFISIDSLPLNTNGKIDRKRLPVPGDILQNSGYVAARNEEEEIMTKIWQNVLDVEQVGIHDNFFDLGGASIQSIQIVAKANMFGYQITVENIFEYQTIAGLAAYIKATIKDSSTA
ncbi:MAG: amino acid adenylation domain-containing protein [Ginsengibacter sp.]